LAWEPRTLEKKVELWVAGELVAWFYHAVLDVGIDRLCITPGYKAMLVSRRSLADLPVSPWHAAALGAWLEGTSVVDLEH
jgi:hypothetical protein